MQSHQEIKANPLDDLPPEILLLEVTRFLRPEEAVRFFSTSAEFRALLEKHPRSTHSFWQQKLQQHFPTDFKPLKDQMNIDWRAEFIKADEKNYRGLTPRVKKLFSIVKAGDLQSFAKENYTLADLDLMDASRIYAIDYANRDNQYAILNYIYEKIAIPYFSDASRHSFDPGKRDVYGRSILHWAVYCQQDLETLQNLIIAGFDVNITSNNGGTPLHIAAYFGQLDTVTTLLAQGANVDAANAKTSGATALYIAAQEGHLAVVNALLTQGADVNVALTDGATALVTAAQKGHLAVVNALLAQGANVDAAMTNGATALVIAAQNGHLAVMKVLLAQGANVNAALTVGATALHIAAQKGHLAVVNTLLAQGADVNAALTVGATALHIAAQNDHLAVVNALLAKGADVNAATRSGATALHIAARNGHDEITKMLTIQRVSNYIKKRGADTAPEYLNSIRIFGHDFHLGSSKHEKIAAASMLKCVLEGAHPSYLQGHEKALGHGELGKIYAAVKNNIDHTQSETLPQALSR